MDHLALYSSNCKSCKFLDPEEKVGFEKCHYSKGNTDCPAKEIQFAVVGLARRAATQVKEARKQSNIQREIVILKAVEKRSPAFRHKFADWLAR